MSFNFDDLQQGCSLHTTWTGFLDWLAERIWGPAPGELPTTSVLSPNSSTWTMFLVVPALVLLMAFIAPIVAPALVLGMNSVGTSAVATLSMGAGAFCALVLFVGAPLLVGRRVYLFSKHCCTRGKELQAGIRKPARPKV